MAIVTKPMATHGDDGAGNPLVVFEIDYDDADLRVRAVRCINNSGQPAYAEASRLDGSRKVSSVFLAGTTTSFVVLTTAPTRLQLTLTPKGGIDGLAFSTVWPFIL